VCNTSLKGLLGSTIGTEIFFRQTKKEYIHLVIDKETSEIAKALGNNISYNARRLAAGGYNELRQ
jgi:hypothetical protein